MTSNLFPDTDITILITIALAAGYLSGSIPYGLLVGKIFGVGDIRKSGSGNIGATNMLRVGGRKLAALTLVLDALKATVPVLIFKACSPACAMAAAAGALIGHLFPVWLKFKGGKGVATAIGLWLGLCWPVGLGIIAFWVATAAIFRISSLAALVSLSLAPFIALAFASPAQAMLASAVTLAVLLKHFGNIRRLLEGTEPKIGQSKSGAAA